MKVALLVVDGQNDFCTANDGCGNKGELVAPGADKDMERLSAMIRRLRGQLDTVVATLDAHQGIGIERPHFWKRLEDGALPDPFTILGASRNGTQVVKYNVGDTGLIPTTEAYTTYNTKLLYTGGPTGNGALGYLRALEANGKYPHVIWPIHCCVGTWGASLVPELAEALLVWELENFARVNYVMKGNNPWTEHFSGISAEVPDPTDPLTQVNKSMVQTLEAADVIAVGGEALSHCVASTVRDLVDNFSNPESVKKLVLLTDASSNVAGFEYLGEAFVKDMVAKGVILSTTTEFLA